PFASVPTQRLPSRSNNMLVTLSLLPSKVGVTNGFTPPSLKRASPKPSSVPTHKVPSGPRARLARSYFPALYVSETPACQWTKVPSPPSQKPPFPSASKELTLEMGIPSSFPKHLTVRSVTWQRGALEARRATHKEPSGSSVMI